MAARVVCAGTNSKLGSAPAGCSSGTVSVRLALSGSTRRLVVQGVRGRVRAGRGRWQGDFVGSRCACSIDSKKRSRRGNFFPRAVARAQVVGDVLSVAWVAPGVGGVDGAEG